MKYNRINYCLLVILILSPIFSFSKNFVLFTEPKTGTHLLTPILKAFTHKRVYWAEEYTISQENWEFDPDRPDLFYPYVNTLPWDRQKMDLVWAVSKQQNSFLHLHAPFTQTMEKYLSENNCVNFFIKRDPRDQLVSQLNHYKYIHLDINSPLNSISSDDERLLHMIKNELRRNVLLYKGWLKSPVCCVLDFQKLMGNHGGAATDQDALEEVRKIAKALKFKISDRHLKRIYLDSFGKGWSFFKGKVGSWKDYFNEEHKAAAKEEIGDLLIELGYETDKNW